MIKTPSTITMIIYILVGIFAMTFVYSILIMFGGKSLFKKANKNPVSAYYPVLNLFTLLEIVDMSSFVGILFFVPIINIFVIWIMFVKLAKVFNYGFLYKLGLIVFPICFYPLLCISDKQYKVSDAEYFKVLDNAKVDSINLMTDEEINNENNYIEEEPKEQVDSIFKKNEVLKEEIPAYKAVRMSDEDLNKLKSADDDIEKIDFGNNNVINNTNNVVKKDEDIEIVDL